MPANEPTRGDIAATETSNSLLALLSERDPDAWNRLVRLYSPLIYSWCRRMQLPEQDMADIFQEVFHAVARNIDKFRHDGPGSTFRGWLRTVTENKVRDLYRRRVKEPRATGGTDAQMRFAQVEFDPSEPELTLDGGTYSELFRAALATIKPHFHEQTWRAFWLVVVEGRTASDVADELQMQPGTVRVAKSRVLHRLRQEIADLEC